MAKLQIKKREGVTENAITMRDFNILVDGQEPSMITELNINMTHDGFNEATLSFYVDDLELDGDFLAILEAKVEESKKGLKKK